MPGAGVVAMAEVGAREVDPEEAEEAEEPEEELLEEPEGATEVDPEGALVTCGETGTVGQPPRQYSVGVTPEVWA